MHAIVAEGAGPIHPIDAARLKSCIQKILMFGRTERLISNLRKDDIDHILEMATEALSKEPTVIDIGGPIVICGGLFGDLRNLLDLLDQSGHPPTASYLMLGDLVNKGKNSIEVVCLLYCYKVLYPGSMWLLRGEQESLPRVRKGGFKTEVKYRFDSTMYNQFVDSFTHLPLAAIVAGKIFGCHGGINRHVGSVAAIRALERPIRELHGIAAAVVLGVPVNRSGFVEVGDDLLQFGCDTVFEFLEANKLDLICRCGGYLDSAYKYGSNRTVLSVFSTRNYCNRDNPCAVVRVDEQARWQVIVFSVEALVTTTQGGGHHNRRKRGTDHSKESQRSSSHESKDGENILHPKEKKHKKAYRTKDCRTKDCRTNDDEAKQKKYQTHDTRSESRKNRRKRRPYGRSTTEPDGDTRDDVDTRDDNRPPRYRDDRSRGVRGDRSCGRRQDRRAYRKDNYVRNYRKR